MNKFLLSLLVLICSSCVVTQQPDHADKISIHALQQTEFSARLSFEKELHATSTNQASLMSYFSDGLKIYTLINRPTSVAPKDGYPILIFGHGFHPTPEKYGISNSTGKQWRPGDYYRGVPEAYAAQGFFTLTPDYRGHNVSEGLEFTKTSYLASSYYARDVLHLVAVLNQLDNVDLSRVYYMGHSMGGDVGLKVLLATDIFKAASLWSPVVSSTQEQALYYGKYYDKTNDKLNPEIMLAYLEKIDKVYAALESPVSFNDVDPVKHLDALNTPLLIQHARGDTSVPYIWSESLVTKLHELGKDYLLYSYESDNHLFKDENFELAIQRDITFFNSH